MRVSVCGCGYVWVCVWYACLRVVFVCLPYLPCGRVPCACRLSLFPVAHRRYAGTQVASCWYLAVSVGWWVLLRVGGGKSCLGTYYLSTYVRVQRSQTQGRERSGKERAAKAVGTGTREIRAWEQRATGNR